MSPPDSRPGASDVATWHTYGASMSPDGSAFAYIVDDRTGYPRAAQRLLSRAGVGPLRWVRVPCAGPVRRVMHSADGRWLAVEVSPGGGEHHQVWTVTTDPDDHTTHRIATRPPTAPGSESIGFATVELIGWDSDHVLITGIAPDGTAHALRVHPATGAMSVLDVRTGGALIDSWSGATVVRVGPRGYRDLLLIRRGQVNQLLPNDPGATSDAAVILDQGFAHPSLVFPSPAHAHQIRDLDSVQLLARSDFDAKFPRLLGIESGRGGVRFRVLAERAASGLDEFAVSPDQTTVALLWNVAGRSELQVMALPDQTLHPVFDLPGEVCGEISISAGGSVIAVTVQSPDRPPRVHLVDVRSHTVTPVDAVGPITDDLRGEHVTFSARDGMPLSGWLYRARDAGAPPGPVLIYFHGGPESQARPDHNVLFAPLVAAGITVFAPNVRGSSGSGRLIAHADDRYGRYAGIDDAADCVEYLVDDAIADPDRVACSGRSYGGYLTLACLTFHPTLFAAGVAICGMSDLESFYRNTEPWIGQAAYTKYGHPDTDRELLHDLSPIHRIDQLRAPLLVIHGAHDTNVPVSESRQMVASVQAAGGRAELLLFDDEGHEIVKHANQSAMTEAMLTWLLDAFAP